MAKLVQFLMHAENIFNAVAQILDQYNFGQMKLHDVAVTPDSLRLLGVGPLLKSPDGLQPSKSRVEKQLVGACDIDKTAIKLLMPHLIVFNMETKVLEKCESPYILPPLLLTFR